MGTEGFAGGGMLGKLLGEEGKFIPGTDGKSAGLNPP
jgi:hypothetical protein